MRSHRTAGAADLDASEAMSGALHRPSPPTPELDSFGAVLREAVRTALPSWPSILPTILYCVRTLAAIGIALHTAFALQLQSPLSSVVTVLIVANPVTGALISKSLWRLLGTLLGATGAVLLMAVLAQSPMLFAIVFSLCIGVACVVSTLLRFFKAYGAVLAGYTIIIVCAPAFADPQVVFESALSRLSAVSVGIVSAALVFLLTNVRPPERLIEATLSLIRNTGAALAGHAQPPAPAEPTVATSDDPSGTLPEGMRAWRRASPGGLADSFYDRRGALLAQATGLTEIIEYAAADDATVRRAAGGLRLGAAGLIGALSTLNPFFGRLGRHEALAAEVRDATGALASWSADDPGPALGRLLQARARLAGHIEASTPPDLDRIGALEHASDLLTRLHRSAQLLAMQPGDRRGQREGRRPRVFLDWPSALRNGARGFIVTMLACLFWYVTQWPSGPILLTYLVPAACLLATNPSASRASIDFSIGTLLAIPASYVCEALLLPRIDGFPLLLASLAICLLPGIWLQFHPRYGLRAFGYVVFFNAMITVRNPISFDDVALVNGWLAFALGSAALVMVFRALLPPDPRRDADRLVRSITRALARLGRPGPPPQADLWENLQMQKVLRLIQRMASMPPGSRHRITDCAFVSIEIGRCVLRLRHLLSDVALQPAEREAVLAAQSAIMHLRHDPHEAGRRAEHAAQRLAGGVATAGLVPALRVAGLMHEIAVLIDAVPDFLSRGFTVPPC